MIKLLIVDDSALMRRILGELFGAEPDFEVRLARDGVEALEQLDAFRPDVITLDVQMPRMDGLACLDRIMLARPTPVVMVSALTQEGADQSIKALELGAIDLVPKPAGAPSLRMDALAPRLLETVRSAAGVRIPRTRRLKERVRALTGVTTSAADRIPAPAPRRSPRRARGLARDGLVLIGASTGGPPALEEVIVALPADFPWPIVVAQHMPATFTGALARRLDALAAVSVVEVVQPTPLAPGTVYIGRGDADVLVGARPGGLVALSAPEAAAYRWHPSVDRLVESALANTAAENLVGVLMTGMGNDGAASMTRLRAAGGRTIAEDESTAVVWGMPGELVRADGAGVVVPLHEIAAQLISTVGRP